MYDNICKGAEMYGTAHKCTEININLNLNSVFHCHIRIVHFYFFKIKYLGPESSVSGWYEWVHANISGVNFREYTLDPHE